MMSNGDVTLARVTIVIPVQERLSQDTDHEVRRALAENPHLDPDLALALVKDPAPGIRLSLSFRPSASAELLAVLSHDIDNEVRGRVARHYNTRVEDLLSLAHDVSPLVVAAAARNVHLPPDELAALATSPDPLVRTAVAANPAAPLTLLTQLAADELTAVRLEVVRNPAMTDEAVLDSLADDPLLCRVVAANDAVSPATLARMVRFPNRSVVLTVASHPRADEATLRYAASLYYPAGVVAANPAAPWNLVVELCAAEWGIGSSMLADAARDRFPGGAGDIAWYAVMRERSARDGDLPPEEMLDLLLGTAAAYDALTLAEMNTFDALFSKTPPGTPVADVFTLLNELNPVQEAQAPAPGPVVHRRSARKPEQGRQH